jgi:hypothetical protein
MNIVNPFDGDLLAAFFADPRNLIIAALILSIYGVWAWLCYDGYKKDRADRHQHYMAEVSERIQRMGALRWLGPAMATETGGGEEGGEEGGEQEEAEPETEPEGKTDGDATAEKATESDAAVAVGVMTAKHVMTAKRRRRAAAQDDEMELPTSVMEEAEEGTKEGATKAAPAESASPYWFVRWWTKFMSTIGSGGMTSSEETRAHDGGLGGGAPSLLARRLPTHAARRAARPLR